MQKATKRRNLVLTDTANVTTECKRTVKGVIVFSDRAL